MWQRWTRVNDASIAVYRFFFNGVFFELVKIMRSRQLNLIFFAFESH